MLSTENKLLIAKKLNELGDDTPSILACLNKFPLEGAVYTLRTLKTGEFTITPEMFGIIRGKLLGSVIKGEITVIRNAGDGVSLFVRTGRIFVFTSMAGAVQASQMFNDNGFDTRPLEYSEDDESFVSALARNNIKEISINLGGDGILLGAEPLYSEIKNTERCRNDVPFAPFKMCPELTSAINDVHFWQTSGNTESFEYIQAEFNLAKQLIKNTFIIAFTPKGTDDIYDDATKESYIGTYYQRFKPKMVSSSKVKEPHACIFSDAMEFHVEAVSNDGYWDEAYIKYDYINDYLENKLIVINPHSSNLVLDDDILDYCRFLHASTARLYEEAHKLYGHLGEKYVRDMVNDITLYYDILLEYMTNVPPEAIGVWDDYSDVFPSERGECVSVGKYTAKNLFELSFDDPLKTYQALALLRQNPSNYKAIIGIV